MAFEKDAVLFNNWMKLHFQHDCGFKKIFWPIYPLLCSKEKWTSVPMAAEIRQFYKPQKLQSIQPLVSHSKALSSASPFYRKVKKCTNFFSLSEVRNKNNILVYIKTTIERTGPMVYLCPESRNPKISERLSEEHQGRWVLFSFFLFFTVFLAENRQLIRQWGGVHHLVMQHTYPSMCGFFLRHLK